MEDAMASVAISQYFNAPVESVFAEITPHKMLADVLPLLSIDTIKQGNQNSDGLNSVRSMGVGFIKPLKEKVVVYEPPYKLEYKMVGVLSKLIKHHHGVLTFTQEKNSNNTLVIWHVELKTVPPFMSRLILPILKMGISNALKIKAKELAV